MKDEYIIINKTKLLERIKELEIERDKSANDGNEYYVGYYGGQIHALYELVSNSTQSTPSIPEIERAFQNGFDYYSELVYEQKHGVGNTTTVKGPNKQDYISNLKLGI